MPKVKATSERVALSPHVDILRIDGVWYSCFKQKRKAPLLKSLRTKSKEEAVKMMKGSPLIELAAHKASDTFTKEVITRLTASRNVTLQQAAEGFYDDLKTNGVKTNSIRHTKSTIDRFLKQEDLLDEPVAYLQTKHIDHHLNKRLIGIKLNTRRRVLSAISTFCRALQTSGLATYNPVVNLRLRTEGVAQELLLASERRPFTYKEIDTLIAACDVGSFWWTAIQVVMHTGIRLADVASLQWASIRDDHFVVYTSKHGIAVKHPLTASLRLVLSKVTREAGSAYLFPDIAYTHERSPTVLSQQFRRLCLRVGIEGRTFHGLRHSYAMFKINAEKQAARSQLMSELLAEMALERTQAAMGHASVESTKHYLNHPKNAVVAPPLTENPHSL